MTIQKQIDFIMTYHKVGQTETAIRLLEGMIRSAMSNKQIKMAQAAIQTIKAQ